MNHENVSIRSRKPAILFVDDEPRILSSLKRLVRPWRESIDASFVNSGEQAIELLKKTHFDVIVSDMRMPGMNGAELLKEIRRTDPAALRVVLSGQAESQLLLEAIEATHRYISKPCEIDTLEKILKEAVLGHIWIESATMRKHIASLTTLPCQVDIVRQFRDEVQNGYNINNLVSIANKDLGLALKVIHIANALIPDMNICTVEQALVTISRDLISKSLDQVIPQIDSENELGESIIKELSKKALLISKFSKQIAEYYLPADAKILEDAGFLVPAGELALLSCFGEEFYKSKENQNLFYQEASNFNVRKISAFLLSLWGIGEEVTRLVAGETDGAEVVQPARVLYTANYLANLTITNNITQDSLSESTLIKIAPLLNGLMVFEGD